MGGKGLAGVGRACQGGAGRTMWGSDNMVGVGRVGLVASEHQQALQGTDLRRPVLLNDSYRKRHQFVTQRTCDLRTGNMQTRPPTIGSFAYFLPHAAILTLVLPKAPAICCPAW